MEDTKRAAKGPDAFIDIKSRYDAVTNRLVPLNAETLTNLRRTLPPPESSTKYAPGQSVIIHTVDTVVTPL